MTKGRIDGLEGGEGEGIWLQRLDFSVNSHDHNRQNIGYFPKVSGKPVTKFPCPFSAFSLHARSLFVFFCVAMYNLSTFALAHGVFRRNFRLDFTEGSLLKHRILMRLPNSFQP